MCAGAAEALILAHDVTSQGTVLPAAPDNHDAHDYAERIRERLPRKLQELREAAGLSKYGLAGACGISRANRGRHPR